MHYATLIIEILLVGYIIRDVLRALPLYRQLKQRIARGEPGARSHMYRQILAFQWITAALALGALGFDWSKLTPGHLALTDSPLVQGLAHQPQELRFFVICMFAGMLAGAAGFIVLRLRRNRRGAEPAAPVHESPLKRWMPDFSALIPVTPHERLTFVAVALSAGVCEEVVFRGWLLSALQQQLGLQGDQLICAAAAVFGLAHAYQKISGVLLTGLLGAILCLLYVATGSLLVPIILHVFLDARFALIPAPKAHKPQAVPA
jgi:membrane protease YdiL (CAAX protease family)